MYNTESSARSAEIRQLRREVADQQRTIEILKAVAIRELHGLLDASSCPKLAMVAFVTALVGPRQLRLHGPT